MTKRLIMTVCYVMRGRAVLLGTQRYREGKRNLGVGLWNGFGGKVEEGEDIFITNARELKDECGLILLSAERCGVVLVTYDAEDFEVELHYFLCHDFEGIPHETEEMIPKWYPFDDLPFDQMWPNDRYQFPLFLNGDRIIGHFHYDDRLDRNVRGHTVRIWNGRPLPDAGSIQRLF